MNNSTIYTLVYCALRFKVDVHGGQHFFVRFLCVFLYIFNKIFIRYLYDALQCTFLS